MKTRTTSRTYQLGASHERQAIKSYLKRQRNEAATNLSRIILTEIIDWIEGRTKRFEAKPGGLGRKRKAKSTAGKIAHAIACKLPSV